MNNSSETGLARNNSATAAALCKVNRLSASSRKYVICPSHPPSKVFFLGTPQTPPRGSALWIPEQGMQRDNPSAGSLRACPERCRRGVPQVRHFQGGWAGQVPLNLPDAHLGARSAPPSEGGRAAAQAKRPGVRGVLLSVNWRSGEVRRRRNRRGLVPSWTWPSRLSLPFARRRSSCSRLCT